MKTIILPLIIFIAFAANGQTVVNTKPTLLGIVDKQSPRMKAKKIELSVDFKFEIISDYIKEIDKRIKTQIANETLNGNLTNEALTNEYIIALKAVQKQFRPRFLKATETIIEVDSLQYRMQQEADNKEMARLKAAISSGQDSTILQPKINSIKNRTNDRNKIINTWKKVVIVN